MSPPLPPFRQVELVPLQSLRLRLLQSAEPAPRPRLEGTGSPGWPGEPGSQSQLEDPGSQARPEEPGLRGHQIFPPANETERHK